MSATDKKPDPRFIAGIVFILSGIPLMAANVAIGVVMIVIGGVLMAGAVAASRKKKQV